MMSGAPCGALEEETEQVAVKAGWNTLVGCEPGRIGRAALEARPGVEAAWPYSDGQVAGRILGTVINLHKARSL